MRFECSPTAPLNAALSVGVRGGPYARVLCATDLSHAGDSAVRVACALTAPGGVLYLLHVQEPSFASSVLGATDPVRWSPAPDGPRFVEEHVRERVRGLRPLDVGRPDVRIVEIRLHHEDVPGVIVNQAGKTGAEIVVVGTHGRPRLGRPFLGSVAMDVLERSPVPIVLFHEAGREAEGRGTR